MVPCKAWDCVEAAYTVKCYEKALVELAASPAPWPRFRVPARGLDIAHEPPLAGRGARPLPAVGQPVHDACRRGPGRSWARTRAMARLWRSRSGAMGRTCATATAWRPCLTCAPLPGACSNAINSILSYI